MWRSTPLVTALAAALALAALAACGGGDAPPPSPTTTVTPTAIATPTAPTTSTPPPPVADTATTTPSPTATPADTPTPSSGAEPCDLIVVGNRYQCRGAVRSSPTPAPTPEPTPCERFDCIRENLCRGVECTKAKPDPKTCQSYDCIEIVPNAFERRIFEPGEHIDWEEGVFFFQVETGRTEAYRVEGAGGHGYAPGGAWVEVQGSYDWRLLLHRESGQAWRWAEGARDKLTEFLKEHLDLDYPVCVAYPVPRPPLGQAGWFGVPCSEVDAIESKAQNSQCQGRLSPDGRYVAQQWGEPTVSKRHRPHPPTLYSSPSVVIADAETCEPLFRIRSAYAYGWMWEGQWLSNSEGFVVGVEAGYAVARVHPSPGLVSLPPVPVGALNLGGPVPAPTGDGRFFAYDFAGVYDAEADRWILSGFDQRQRGPFSWGETHEEVRYIPGLLEGGSGVTWMLSAPRIESPPFEDVAFRVARTGSCLHLRSEPDLEAAVLDCLPDGTRVVLEMPPRHRGEWSCGFGYGSYSCLPAIRESRGDNIILDWVYVRSEAGLEGWTAFSRIEGFGTSYESYLDHD